MIIPGESREPEPGIETVLAQAREGAVPITDVLAALVAAELTIPSLAEFADDWSKVQPVLSVSPDGASQLVAYTAPDRAAGIAANAPFTAPMTGRAILSKLMPGVGLMLNPGFGLGMSIAADDVPHILATFPE